MQWTLKKNLHYYIDIFPFSPIFITIWILSPTVIARIASLFSPWCSANWFALKGVTRVLQCYTNTIRAKQGDMMIEPLYFHHIGHYCVFYFTHIKGILKHAEFFSFAMSEKVGWEGNANFAGKETTAGFFFIFLLEFSVNLAYFVQHLNNMTNLGCDVSPKSRNIWPDWCDTASQCE